MSFAREPAPADGSAPSTAILLCNLGTPAAPTTPAVRRYLAEFLHDPRVIEIPRIVWCPILHGIVLRTRPAQSAKRYASVWTPQGSPLTVWTDKQAKLLGGYLGQRGHRVTVRFAMRYGAPSIASVMDELKAGGARQVLVLPMYPQYCAATTGSVSDAIFAWGKRVRSLPELRFVSRFHDDPRYIDALVKRLMDHWMANGRGEKLVMSFHGMPKRTQTLGDPYFAECMETAHRVALRADVKTENLVVTFQSRLGRAEWLQPYTEPTLVKLAKQGIRKVDVMCPGFVADNLETLEEIAQEARDAFLKAGGTDFNYVPCLNDQHEWMAALTTLALQHMQGWETRAPQGAAAV
jgi:protoporphyrin/coproporphyrin ferrochelatase